MTIDDLKNKYDKLLKDEDFDRLDLGLKNPNIFSILQISKTEIRHSNFLSWLLDPNQSHKLGDIFLKRFLREVFSSDIFEEVDQVDVEGMDLTQVEILREWRNIDLLIKLPDVVVCIENKVLSKEHSNQLTRYLNTVNTQFPRHKKTFVYLTPDGDISQDESEMYYPISYEFIVETLKTIISVYGDSINNQVKFYIKDYITIIKRELMGTDKLSKLSLRIYQNHKELFDFILKHRPEVVDDLGKIIREEVVNRGWILGSQTKYLVRFFTQPIEKLIYFNKRIKNGWTNGETFLFEIRMGVSSNTLGFKTTISKSDEEYNRDQLEEILLELDGFTKSRGRTWIGNYSKKEKFDYEKVLSLSDDEIRNQIKKYLDKITPTIMKVEKKFIEHSEELLEMKNV